MKLASFRTNALYQQLLSMFGPDWEVKVFPLGTSREEIESWHKSVEHITLSDATVGGGASLDRICKKAAMTVFGIDYSTTDEMYKKLFEVLIGRHGLPKKIWLVRDGWGDHEYFCEEEIKLEKQYGRESVSRDNEGNVVDWDFSARRLKTALRSLLGDIEIEETNVGFSRFHPFDDLRQQEVDGEWVLHDRHALLKNKKGVQYCRLPVETFLDDTITGGGIPEEVREKFLALVKEEIDKL